MMKFTDLNFDCLETVLEYLELIDLLNVADSTKRLNKAAKMLYARVYGSKTLFLRRVKFGDMRVPPHQSFRITDKTVEINGLKTCLQLLRCVGCAVPKIQFSIMKILEGDAENQYQIDRKIFIYINKYCAEYLKAIDLPKITGSIKSHRCDLFECFDKPFNRLSQFFSLDYKFTRKSVIKRVLPKLQKLVCGNRDDVSFYRFNTNHFPHLEDLQIEEYGGGYGSILQNKMVLPFLQLNPQLKRLMVTSISSNLRLCNLNLNLIRNAVDSLQNIETLTLDIKPISFIKSGDNYIHMKSVKSFYIRLKQLYKLPVCCLPFSFQKLEEFAIRFPKTKFHRSFTEQFFTFIDKHSTITHLSISGFKKSRVMDWSRLAESLPLLVELSSDCWLSADEAIEFINKLQMLKKIRFKLSDNYDDFCKRMGNKWEGIYASANQSVKLKRRF